MLLEIVIGAETLLIRDERDASGGSGSLGKGIVGDCDG